MSVPTWKRSMSKSQFLYELYQLNITVGEIMDNQSKKHKDNYSNHVIKTALYALQMAQTANEIYFNAQTANHARYMDDSYAIDEIETLELIEQLAIEKAAELGITVNEQKTHIHPFVADDFVFLKNLFILRAYAKAALIPIF